MDSEEPQSPSSQSKVTKPVPVDEMDIDQPVTKALAEDVKSPTAPTIPTETPLTNGNDQQSTISQSDDESTKKHEEDEALVTKTSDLSKSTTDVLPSTADIENKQVNGTAEVESKSSEQKVASDKEKITDDAEKSDGQAQTDALTSTAETDPSPKKDLDKEDPSPSAGADSMDIDIPTAGPDVASSAEHIDDADNSSNMRDAENVSDAPIASSPPDSSQPADISKLEIKATQEEDIPMIESVASLGKISREREEDDTEEPAAKRARTEDGGETTLDSLVVASSADVATSAQPKGNKELDSAIPDNLPITPHQNKRTREVLANVKKTKNGGNFRKSVQDLWPGLWNDYSAKIDNPIDISLMEVKLREDKYANYGQFKADVNQLYENAVIFNGPLHDVSRAAAQVRDYILVRMPEIIHTKEPVKPEKGKAQPTRHTEPRAATQPRRQSQSQTQGPATSPKSKSDPSSLPTTASTTAQTFAIPPSGIPQIRRDSTRDDGDRPKRPIHPPKNRDPEYASKASRKKKLDPEQRFFDTVLEEVKKVKHYAINQWFIAPVDPVALNIPNYFKVIKKPMDLGKMTEKNYDGEYKSMKDVEKDMRLIVHNSEIFNGPDHDVSNQARQLEELLKSQLAGKDKWMERHYPAAAPSATHASTASPDRSFAESEDDSEGDRGDKENDAIQGLQQRLNEEQEKLNQLLNSKKPDLMMMEVQQSLVAVLQRKLVEERTKFLSEKRPKKKKSAPSKNKSKAAPNTSLAGHKRMSGSISTSKKPAGGNKKPAPPKKRAIGALEKAVIAEGINELDGNTLTKAVEIIKRDTGQNENDEGEMELDIDSLTSDALGRLYDLINKAHPNVRQTIAKKPEHSKDVNTESEAKAKPGGVPKAKKNKPMNKHEQERKIEQLRELKAQLQRHGSGSQEPIPETELPAAGETSEESDSEEE